MLPFEQELVRLRNQKISGRCRHMLVFLRLVSLANHSLLQHANKNSIGGMLLFVAPLFRYLSLATPPFTVLRFDLTVWSKVINHMPMMSNSHMTSSFILRWIGLCIDLCVSRQRKNELLHYLQWRTETSFMTVPQGIAIDDRVSQVFILNSCWSNTACSFRVHKDVTELHLKILEVYILAWGLDWVSSGTQVSYLASDIINRFWL